MDIENYSSSAPISSLHKHCLEPHCKGISWSAVFVGAIVGLGLSLLLNLLGIAIGLSTFTFSKEGATLLAIGGIIGIIIGIIIAMLAAGYAAGYLGRIYCANSQLAIIYGFLTWCIALILSAILIGHVGNYAATYNNPTTNPISISLQNAQSQQNTNISIAEVKHVIHGFAWSAFTIFAFFLIGAVAACLGAYWAMSSDTPRS